MQRFVMKLLFAPVAFVSGDQLLLEDQPYFIDSPHNRDLAMCVLRRHRVAVAVEPDQRQRVRMCVYDAMRFKSLPR